MATMYETIMNLPLFKGLSHEQVSSFLEKTNLKFSKYSDREKIIDAGTNVNNIKCVISGQVRICHKIGTAEDIKLLELQQGHNVLGADRLFGMDTAYGFDAYAVGNVSTMEFSKEQYINLLNTGSIYLINYLNFLSYRAQIRYDIFNNYPDGSFAATCSRLIRAYCSKKSTDISLAFNIDAFALFCNMDSESLSKEIRRLEILGIIRQNPLGITILSKDEIVG